MGDFYNFSLDSINVRAGSVLVFLVQTMQVRVVVL